jgi:hypothetical protein
VAARESRKTGRELFRIRKAEVEHLYVYGMLGVLVLAAFAVLVWRDTFELAGGEPFSAISGTSVWPAEALRLIAIILALVFGREAHSQMRIGILEICRRYRLRVAEAPRESFWTISSTGVPAVRVNVADWWRAYQEMGFPGQRTRRVALAAACYAVFGTGLFFLGEFPRAPIRGHVSAAIDQLFLVLSVLSFLILAFGTIDAVRLCRWFIERLTAGTTVYPECTLQHFKRQRALTDSSLLDEWIDLQLIADLTERVGRLIYFPFIIFFVLLFARNGSWDNWTWPWPLIAVLSGNLVLCVTSVVMLQRAARRARDSAIQSLQAKSHGRIRETKSEKEHAADEAKLLLDEIRSLRRGAFVPLWENPLVGALLIPSGGTVLIEMTAYLLAR